jgi:uncharacterized membrane protein (TIGR02234 family)
VSDAEVQNLEFAAGTPEPGSGPGNGDGDGRGPGRRRSGRRMAVLLGLLGALLVVLGTSRPWATVTVTGLPSLNEISVSGRRIAPAGLPVALAAALGAFVLAIARRVVRYLVGVGLSIAGVALAVDGVRAGRSESGAIHLALRDSLGIVNRSSGAADSFVAGTAAQLNGWYVVYVIGAVLIAVAGVVTLLTGAGWPGAGRRFEASPGRGPRRSSRDGPGDGARSGTDSADAWDALSRGEDPTSPGEDQT